MRQVALSGYKYARKKLLSLADKKRAVVLKKFFKTGEGGYARKDVFIGVTVPLIRKLSIEFKNLGNKETLKLLRSPIHEQRLLALLILVLKYKNAGEKEKKKLYEFYLKNTKYINNWDLVDLTCYHIAGEYLFDKNKSVLYRLARSKNLWERRIAIVSTFYFIKKGIYAETFGIIKILLYDKCDLIHKAAGWMLREVGKRIGEDKEEFFLRKYCRVMPRVMLRYAIERFPEKKRKEFLISSRTPKAGKKLEPR